MPEAQASNVQIEKITDIIEVHLHNHSYWFGSTGGVAPGLQTSLTPFRVTSAAVANTFGAEVVIFNGTETPVITGKLSFDPHQISIIDVENNNKTYRLRITDNYGGYATYAAAVAAGHYSDTILRLTTAANQSAIIPIMLVRVPVGTIIWAALATLDAVAQWMDFVIGIHEYDDSV